MTPQLNDKQSLIAQIKQKDVLLSYPFENIKSFTNLLYEAARDDSVVSIKNFEQDLMRKAILNTPESWKKPDAV